MAPKKTKSKPRKGIGVKKCFAVKARDAVYRRPAVLVPSRKKPAAAAFCSKRQVSACSGKVTREYKNCDTVQCDDIGELLEASWGAKDNVVDVTEQVKKLQLSSKSFTADAKTLGDPCPRHVKRLRLIRQVSACSGTVTREYKSRDTIQCDDIGELFEALWGAGDNVVDVKEQVKKLQLSSNSFTADARTLGDPCPGKVKKLRLIHKGSSRQ